MLTDSNYTRGPPQLVRSRSPIICDDFVASGLHGSYQRAASGEWNILPSIFAACHSCSEFLGLAARTPFVTHSISLRPPRLMVLQVYLVLNRCLGGRLTYCYCLFGAVSNCTIFVSSDHNMLWQTMLGSFMNFLANSRLPFKLTFYNMVLVLGVIGRTLASHIDVRGFEPGGTLSCLTCWQLSGSITMSWNRVVVWSSQ